MDIEGPQDSLVPTSVSAYCDILIGIDLFGCPIDTEPPFEEYLDGLLPGYVFRAWEDSGKPGQATGYHEGEVIASKLRHLRAVHTEHTVGTVWDWKGRIETSVTDVLRFAGPARALVRDGLEGIPLLIITPHRVEPLLEGFKVRSAPIRPLDSCGHLRRAGIQSLGTTIRSSCQRYVLSSFHCSWLTRTGSIRFFSAFIDIPKLLQALDLLESI